MVIIPFSIFSRTKTVNTKFLGSKLCKVSQIHYFTEIKKKKKRLLVNVTHRWKMDLKSVAIVWLGLILNKLECDGASR